MSSSFSLSQFILTYLCINIAPDSNFSLKNSTTKEQLKYPSFNMSKLYFLKKSLKFPDSKGGGTKFPATISVAFLKALITTSKWDPKTNWFIPHLFCQLDI